MTHLTVGLNCSRPFVCLLLLVLTPVAAATAQGIRDTCLYSPDRQPSSFYGPPAIDGCSIPWALDFFLGGYAKQFEAACNAHDDAYGVYVAADIFESYRAQVDLQFRDDMLRICDGDLA